MDQPRYVDPAPGPSPFGDVDSDAELLKAFAAATPGSASAQAVLTQIVARHGTMVYRVALRMVCDPTLVDDVFQATFLVLAQSARKIQKSTSLASWLHGTARNIGRRALNDKYGVRSQTTTGAEMVTAVEDDPFTEMIRSHERQLLDEELQQLPEIYRAPLVLHYFEQRSNPEISQWLGITVAAVESRLKRAKQLLRARLVRRGMTLSVAVAALGASSSLATATPSVALVSSTITLAATTPAITASLTTVAASAVLQLAGKELATMSAASKITALLLTTAGTLTLGGAVLFGAAYGGLNGGGQGTATASQELNGIIETNTEMGVLAEEPQPVTLAMSNEPPKTATEAPTEAKVESPKATEPQSAEDADLVEKLNENTQKIKDALAQSTTFNFIETPLNDALKSIATQHGITIVLDSQGIRPYAPVTAVVNGVTLRSALKLMLEKVGDKTLDFLPQHGVLFVGTAEQIQIRKARNTPSSVGSESKSPTTDEAQRPSTQDSTTVITGNNIQVTTKDMQFNTSELRVNGTLPNQSGASSPNNRASIVAAIRNLSAADRKVYEALDQEASLNFAGTPLEKALEELRTQHKVNIWTDLKSLEDEGVNLHSLVYAQLSKVPLRTGLSLMLEKVGDIKLDFYVDRGVLCITTAEKTREIKSSRTYNLTGGFKNIFPMAEAYVSEIKEANPGTLEAKSQEGSLVIEASYATHEQIEDHIIKLVQATHTRNDSNQNIAQADASGTKQAELSASSATSSDVKSANEQPDSKGVSSDTNVASSNGASLLGDSGSEHRAPILSGIRNLTAADRRVYQALDQTTRLEFPDNPIQEVFDFVAELHDIRIRFDRRSLEDEGVNLESRVKCVIGDVSLRTALSLILDSAEGVKLDYYVDGGILFITTEDAVNYKKSLRFYDLSSELVNLPEVIEEYAENFEASEPGTLELTSFGDCLAIETSFAIHKKIEEMIVGVMQVAEARKAAGKELTIPKPKPAPTRSVPAQPAPTTVEPQQPAGSVGGSGAAGGIPAGNPGGGFIGGGSGGFN